MESIERIGIIGNGAVGMLMASFLNQDYEVTLYGRVEKEKMLTIHRTGVTNADVTVRLAPVTSLKESDQDVFFVTTKAHQVEAATEKLSGDVPVFICANGISHLDYAAKRGFHLGVVEHGVVRDGSTIEHRGLGRVRIGSLSGMAPLSFADSPLQIIWVDDMMHVITEKLFANAIINPITALCRVPNGKLLTSPYKEVAESIYSELSSLFDETVPYRYVESVIKNTASNRSSMLRDLEEGRPTEVDAILTPIIRKAEEKQVLITVIPLLHKLILGANASC